MPRTPSTRKRNDVTDPHLNSDGHTTAGLPTALDLYELAYQWAKGGLNQEAIIHAFRKGHGCKVSDDELLSIIKRALDDFLTESLEVVTVASVAAEPVTWLWCNRIPNDKLTLLW